MWIIKNQELLFKTSMNFGNNLRIYDFFIILLLIFNKFFNGNQYNSIIINKITKFIVNLYTYMFRTKSLCSKEMKNLIDRNRPS